MLEYFDLDLLFLGFIADDQLINAEEKWLAIQQHTSKEPVALNQIQWLPSCIQQDKLQQSRYQDKRRFRQLDAVNAHAEDHRQRWKEDTRKLLHKEGAIFDQLELQRQRPKKKGEEKRRISLMILI